MGVIEMADNEQTEQTEQTDQTDLSTYNKISISKRGRISFFTSFRISLNNFDNVRSAIT